MQYDTGSEASKGEEFGEDDHESLGLLVMELLSPDLSRTLCLTCAMPYWEAEASVYSKRPRLRGVVPTMGAQTPFLGPSFET